jgi:ADP-heptose:LPS heptosyltransferase
MSKLKIPIHIRIFDFIFGIKAKAWDLIFANHKPIFGPFQNILVINLMGLGNMIFSIPLMKTLRKNYPEARITLLASYAPVKELMAEHKDLVDNIIFFNSDEHKGLFKKKRFMKNLGKRKFDLSVLTYPSGKFSGIAAWFIGAKKRIAVEQKIGLFKTGVLATSIVRSNSKHCVDVNLDIMKALHAKDIDNSIALNVPEESVKNANELLKQRGWLSGQKLIGVHTGSVPETWYKQWNQHGFAEACTTLAKKHNAKIMIVGGPDELRAGESIHAMMNEKPIMFFNKTIPETAALIKNCNVFISTDTGPGHMASALGIPVVSIFGPTDSEKAKPYGKNVIVVQSKLECVPCIDSFTANYFKCKERKCLVELEPEKIVEAVEKMI